MVPPKRDIQEITMEDVPEEEEQELQVRFYPELYLQRRIWVLDILRRENISQVLDIGCGEGELLAALCQPALWLTAPPESVLPLETPKSPVIFNSEDEIPNLHCNLVHGLDISARDLDFAIKATEPPQEPEDETEGSRFYSRYSTTLTRFEDLEVKLWKGGLEVINEEFVNLECIVSTEVIEHLPPTIFPFFAPVILGVYHPKTFLMTTPSYTFNARFTSPDAPPSARKGHPDPTHRTNRIFRHSDHKFEWTTEEFKSWCAETSKQYGYTVTWESIGRATTSDPYGRDEQLGGASFVAEFRKQHNAMDDARREKLGRETVATLSSTSDPTSHELVAHHQHRAHSSSRNPKPLAEIGRIVKAKMEEYREGFMRLEELWFEREISTSCGGWVELLVKAVEESDELILKKEFGNTKRTREHWTVELVGALEAKSPWIDADESARDNNVDYPVPPGWIPGEGSLGPSDASDWGSAAVEGDISLCGSAEEDETGCDSTHNFSSNRGKWYRQPAVRRNTDPADIQGWGGGDWGQGGQWAEQSSEDELKPRHKKRSKEQSSAGSNTKGKDKFDGNTSTAGWDGDADSDTE